MIRQGITTKWLPATDTLGSRCRATAYRGARGSVTVPWDHALNVERNHAAAAKALCDKLGWTGTYVQGGHPAESGYVFVRVQSGCYAFHIEAGDVA